MDLSIGAQSTATDSEVPAHGNFVDRFSRARVDPGGVGARDRSGTPP